MAERKFSDAQYEAALRESAGLYARTARFLQKVHGIPCSRIMVRAWAEKHPDIMQDINDTAFDEVQQGLFFFIKGGSKEERVSHAIQLRAIETYIKYKGKMYGWVESSETELLTKHKINLKVG